MSSPPGEGPDLRLAPFSLGVWLAAIATLRFPLRYAAAGAAVVLVAAAACAWWLRRQETPSDTRDRYRTRWAWPALAAAIGVALGTGVTATAVLVRDGSAAPVGAQVEADVVVRDDPRQVGSAGGRASWLIAVDLQRIAVGAQARTSSARAIVLASNDQWRKLLPGQPVRLVARTLSPRAGDLNAVVLSTAQPPAGVGPPSWMQQAAGSLRAGLRAAAAPLPDEPGGLLPGLVVGDTSALDPGLAADFRTTGMTHLLAVSGGNIAIVLSVVLLLVRWVRLGPRLGALACGVALVGFVILCRPSPSVLRAAAMGTIGLIALASGRPRTAAPALCATVAALILYDPALAVDAGFALSTLATGGLLLLAPRWRDGLRERGVPAGLAEALAVPAAAQVTCGPVIAAMSGGVSLVAVLANLVVAPVVAPATVLGVLAAVVSPLSPTLAYALMWCAQWAGWCLVLVARYGADLPAAVLPWPGGAAGGILLAALTLLLLLAGRRPLGRIVLLVTLAAVVVGAVPVRVVAGGWPPHQWLIVACDVGQGDASVLATDPGAAVVIDAGPEPVATDQCLRRLGITRVRLLVISHFHADHVGGVSGVFRHRQVDAVAISALAEPPAGRALLRRAAARTPTRIVQPGWSYAAGAVQLRALGGAAPMRGTRSDPNNNSVVLAAVVAGTSALFLGDAELERQQQLHDSGAIGPVQVLKVAHHGSAYQAPELLDVVRPTVALVSVGAGNRYGHPSASVLSYLVRRGAQVARTDSVGDIAVCRDSGGGLLLAVRGRAPP